MIDAPADPSAALAGTSIVDVVEEVVAADVAAYGVGWPDKIPPPETVVPHDGWTVQIPGTDRFLIDVVAATTGLTSRFALLGPWIAGILVAALVVGGVLAFTAGRGGPAPAPSASASASSSASASAQATCAQVPTGAPIVATFDQPTFSTTYASAVSNSGRCGVTLQWGGPNCGTWMPQGSQTSSDPAATTTMVWQHPHPPCDPTTDHSDVTVTLTVGYLGGTFTCSYQGAASGTGSPCVAH